MTFDLDYIIFCFFIIFLVNFYFRGVIELDDPLLGSFAVRRTLNGMTARHSAGANACLTLREVLRFFPYWDIFRTLIWSDVWSRLLAKLGSLIVMHCGGFEALPSITVSPVTKK